jgi:hypothetical protein
LKHRDDPDWAIIDSETPIGNAEHGYELIQKELQNRGV